MRLSLRLEFSTRQAALYPMADDLIDRLAKKKQAEREASEQQQKIALMQAKTVEENSLALWRELMDQAKALTEKYNDTFGGKFQFRPWSGQDRGFEVVRDVFPLVSLSVSQPSAQFLEFEIRRTEGSFSQEKRKSGRISVKADLHGNISMVAPDGTPLPTAKHVVEYLLEPVFS
jgi:hypothetical protein